MEFAEMGEVKAMRTTKLYNRVVWEKRQCASEVFVAGNVVAFRV